jgi:ABC-type antimicrobial peptide transport system permease subunit
LSNVQSVINSATKLGFERISVKNNINADLVRIIQVSCNVLLALVLFTIILVTSSYIKKKILNERRIIGILRTCGYKRNTVKNIYLLETILTNIFSYFIGIIIFLIIYVALKNTVLHNFTYFGLTTTINIFSLLFSLIIIILIPTFITFYHINKKSKIDIANLIGSEE